MAEREGCSYIEVPAGFVPTIGEMRLANQGYGEFLSSSAMRALYEREYPLPSNLRYIFHTDSGFDMTSGSSCYRPHALEWGNPDWVRLSANMLLRIASHLALFPDAVEIHAGGPRSPPPVMAKAAILLSEIFEVEAGTRPLIVLENLTKSSVYAGTHLAEFWKALEENATHEISKFGIVLDVSGFLSAEVQRKIPAVSSLLCVPLDATRGLHIHQSHGPVRMECAPKYWEVLRMRLGETDRSFFVNPEVHTADDFHGTIAFCRNFLFNTSIPGVPLYRSGVPPRGR